MPVDSGPRAAAHPLGRLRHPGLRLVAARPRRQHRRPRRRLRTASRLVPHLGLQGHPRRRPRSQAALGPGHRHPGRRPRRRTQDASPDRHPAARAGRLEALPGRRHGRLWLHGERLLARPRRPPRRPHVRRRPDRLPLRPRGRRQPLLLRPRRHRAAPPHRPRRVLRPQRLQRRHAGGVPVRGRPVDRGRPRARLGAAQARRTAERSARGTAYVPGARSPARGRRLRRRDGPRERRRRTRQPVLAHPPGRPGPHHRGHPRGTGAAAGDARGERPDRVRRRTRRARTPSRSPTCPGRPAPARPGGWPPGASAGSWSWSRTRRATDLAVASHDGRLPDPRRPPEPDPAGRRPWRREDAGPGTGRAPGDAGHRRGAPERRPHRAAPDTPATAAGRGSPS